MRDFCVPAGTEPSSTDRADGVEHALWSATELRDLMHAVAQGATGLRAIPETDLYEAWESTITEFLDPDSSSRKALAGPLISRCGLSAPALAAALEAMLRGFTGDPARTLIARGRRNPPRREGVALAVLAGNIPALAVQVMLPALAAGRPLLIKSSSTEPVFAPSLLRRLADRLPEAAGGLAAVCWAGGDRDVEAAVMGETSLLVAYGHRETLADLERRFDGELVALGPRLSIGVVAKDADFEACARGLAEDIALFEQRGCLSVQTVFTNGEPAELADALGRALERQAEVWPPSPLAPPLASEIQQLRLLDALEGAPTVPLDTRAGTVLIVPAGRNAPLRPLPGGRCVRVQGIETLSALPALLEPWRSRIQGATLAGDHAWELEAALGKLGVNRLSAPGDLQRPDALWANGDRHLVDLLR